MFHCHVWLPEGIFFWGRLVQPVEFYWFLTTSPFPFLSSPLLPLLWASPSQTSKNQKKWTGSASLKTRGFRHGSEMCWEGLEGMDRFPMRPKCIVGTSESNPNTPTPPLNQGDKRNLSLWSYRQSAQILRYCTSVIACFFRTIFIRYDFFPIRGRWGIIVYDSYHYHLIISGYLGLQ